MSLLDDARAEQRHNGPTCSVAGLDSALVDEINEALNDPRLHRTTISRVLERRGSKISPDTLRRHAERGKPGGCACPS